MELPQENKKTELSYHPATELLNLNPKEMKLLQSVPYTHIFKLQIIKDVNMCSHVQSHKLVHVSGTHCHVHTSCTSGCSFVNFTEQ